MNGLYFREEFDGMLSTFHHIALSTRGNTIGEDVSFVVINTVNAYRAYGGIESTVITGLGDKAFEVLLSQEKE